MAVAEPSESDGRRPSVVRRREREAAGPRSNRFKISYNDAELAILREAANRANTALASWIGTAALAVAKEEVVPVSVDAKDVVKEIMNSRAQLRRAGNNVNQIARVLNSDGTVTDEQLRAALAALKTAIQRVDEATLQLMRERRPRS